MRLLIAGISTRAAADSAARAGFEVTAIDAFGDLDQHPAVRSVSLPREAGRRPTAAAMAHATRAIACDAVAYLSSFENHPRAVATLSTGRTLLGNPPEVLRRVRDPMQLADVLRRRGFSVPEVRVTPDTTYETEVRRADLSRRSLAKAEAAVRRRRPDTTDERAWLMKPLLSGGGQGIRPWHPEKNRSMPSVARGCYLQERIEGTPGSVVFVSAGGRAVPLAVSRQLIGDQAFGAAGYRYCGSILARGDAPFAPDRPLGRAAAALAQAVSEEFGLVGLNGIDFIANGDTPYAIEVNPRWCSSMELVERAGDVSLFAAHAAACHGGAPDVRWSWRRPDAGAVGKAIVFAREDVVAGDTRAWLDDSTVRDVPHPGGVIPAGRPVCTVFAEGRDAAGCYAALVGRADAVYTALTAVSRSFPRSSRCP